KIPERALAPARNVAPVLMAPFSTHWPLSQFESATTCYAFVPPASIQLPCPATVPNVSASNESDNARRSATSLVSRVHVLLSPTASSTRPSESQSPPYKTS